MLHLMFVNLNLFYVNDTNIQFTSTAHSSSMNMLHPKAYPTHTSSIAPSVSLSCQFVSIAEEKDLTPSEPCQSIAIEWIHPSACPATP